MNNPYANDVTCFVNYGPNQYYGGTADYTYGTHNGIYGSAVSFNDDSLPSLNISYIYNLDGAYYIGTDRVFVYF